jgi:tetratricopeptide (TPR) repeat protein
VIDTQAGLAAFESRVRDWFAQRLPDAAPDASPTLRLALLARLFQGCLGGKSPLDPLAVIQFELGLLAALPPFLPADLGPADWPVTIQQPLDELFTVESRTGQIELHCLVTVMESFLHTHFVVQASQCAWGALRHAGDPGDARLGASTALLQCLRTKKCFGLTDWLDWAALLSTANAEHAALGAPSAFPALDALLEPTLITPQRPPQVAGRWRLRPDDRGTRWVKSGGAVYDGLRFWCVDLVRNLLHAHQRRLDLPPITPGLLTLLRYLIWLFAPYRGLHLALIGITPDAAGPVPDVRAVWEGATLYSAASALHGAKVDARFNRPPLPGGPRPRPPAPPHPGGNANLDSALLLFDPAAPYARYLYLMPLGARYDHADQGDQGGGGARAALLECVRWQDDRVVAVMQRPSDAAWPLDPAWREQAHRPEPHAEEAARNGALRDSIDALAHDLERRFGFDLGGQGPTAASAAAPSRYLDQEALVQRLLTASVPRADALAGIRRAALASPHRRLLLTGCSGIGKSVLLAQLYRVLAGRAVYFSMDQPPPLAAEPAALTGPGADAESLGPPVRTHILAGFCRLADRPGPSGLRGREDARRDLADCLAALAAQDPAPVWLLLDGLNQAADANELLDGLPEPLPANLRLVACTQDIPFVIANATAAGARPWTPLPAATLEDDCARALLATAWGDAPAPAIPADLLRVLLARSERLPVFLQPWGQWLHALWEMQGGDWAAVAGVVAKAPHDPFPDGYRDRLDQALAGHRPAWLPAAALTVLALVGQPLSAAQVARGLRLLYPHLDALADAAPAAGRPRPDRDPDPAPIPEPPPTGLDAQDAAEALARLGGFLLRQSSDGTPRWRPVHERLGRWYLDRRIAPARLGDLREALVPIGADPLLDTPPQDQRFAAWLADLLGRGDRLLQLPPRERLRVLDRLWSGAPKPADPDGQDRLRAVWLAWRGHAQAEAMALAAGLRDSGESVAILEALRERLGADFPADWARDLAGAYRSRSSVPFYRGDWDADLADSERSRQCLEDLRAALGDACPAPWLNDLAWSCGNRGNAHQGKGDWDAALGDYGRAIALQEDLRAALGDAFPAPWLSWLATSYANRGLTHNSKGDQDAALGDYGHAIALKEDLHAALGDAFPAPWLNDLAFAYMNRGVAHDSKGNWDAALGDYRRAIALREDLRAALGDTFPAPWLDELATIYMNSGIAHDSKGDQDAALGDYGRAIALWDDLRATLGERFPADWATWQERTQTRYEALLAAPRR